MAEKKVTAITDSNFDETIKEGISLVDFWAPWCGPCVAQAPILERVAQQMGDKVKIYKINVDEHREMAMKYQVQGIPTLLVFKDGKPVNQFVGVQQDKTLIKSLEAASA